MLLPVMLAACAGKKPISEAPSPEPPAPPLIENSGAAQATARVHPKIGLVLGPGGMKTFAQLGFLAELEKAKIPIEAVTGLEWGAMMAGFYSVQGRAYDAQWKMMKMTEKDLPQNGVFDGQHLEDVESLGRFLGTSLSTQTIERSAIPFSCPAQSTLSGLVSWYSSGSLVQAVKHCIPYPPLFAAKDNLVAATFAFKEAADQLRRQGVSIVILVDVVADGGMMSAKMAADNSLLYLMWLSVQAQVRSSHAFFDEVFHISARDKGLTDFGARRTLIQSGEQAGVHAVEYLTKKYGL